MTAYLALHHGALYNGVLADSHTNDPFVWVSPFLWSHCHARPRPASFGVRPRAPMVHGRDAMFFAAWHPETQVLVCDCVLVLERAVPIAEAAAQWDPAHPVTHFHFDHEPGRCPKHARSSLTRVADPDLSFVCHPAMELGPWIDDHLRPGIPVATYFRDRRIKSARVIERDAQGLYDRLEAWAMAPGHQRLRSLPIDWLQLNNIQPEHPGPVPIDWTLV